MTNSQRKLLNFLQDRGPSYQAKMLYDGIGISRSQLRVSIDFAYKNGMIIFRQGKDKRRIYFKINWRGKGALKIEKFLSEALEAEK